MRKRHDGVTTVPTGPQDSHEVEGFREEPQQLHLKPDAENRGTPHRHLDISSSSLHPVNIWRYCSGNRNAYSGLSSRQRRDHARRGLSKPGGEDTAKANQLYVEKPCMEASGSRVHMPNSRQRARSFVRLRVRNQRKRQVKKDKLGFISRSQGSLRRIISIPRFSRSSASTNFKDEQRLRPNEKTPKGAIPNEAQDSPEYSASSQSPGGSSVSKTGLQSSNPESPQSARRRNTRDYKRRKKLPDDISDGEEEDLVNTRSANRPSSSKEYACPFFKAYPSQHLGCRDSGWVERRKVKDHLKRYHYNGNAPSEIQHSHSWDDWYKFIVKDTDREARAIPNSDPNFVRILCYLLQASEQLEGQEAPCFGTRMLKLFQHAQRNPTETESIIRGIAAILDRPYDPISLEPETFPTEITTVNPSFQSHLHHADLQYISENVYPRLDWPTEAPPVSAHAIPNAVHDVFNEGNLEASQYLILTAEPRHGKDWEITPIVAHSDTTGDIEELVRFGDSNFNPHSVDKSMDELMISQDATCHEVQAGCHEATVPPGTLSRPPLQDFVVPIQAPVNGFVDPKRTQISNMDSIQGSDHSEIPLSLISPSEYFVQTGHPVQDAIPAPTFVQPQRRLMECTSLVKRKRPRAESVGNILIPSLESRFNALPTPSPSVLSKAGSIMTPSLLTPFTANTTGFPISTHMILVISGRRPEIFTFSGSISNSIDTFVEWINHKFNFDFSDMNREFWFMNESVPLYNKAAVLAQLVAFWGESGDMFFNKVIPWFWIDMPCRCLIEMNSTYRLANDLKFTINDSFFELLP
ncbi:hypothetical protein TWF217_011081 [Orbilia oligospora]|nr:hypothetical protein TWF128_001875 [Orbilia oligospora]KAF3235357.1 hypothetical protein TWF128_001875 [Orbilia oligospora]KAF3243972.1 hypothetical protein TWF217_011081 [Orbilia oligospora]KAF3291749.1 hypothetical protein TWF132_006495 [Orbilia oligospora]